MENFLEILIHYRKEQDIIALQRRFDNYIEPLHELFPFTIETENLLYGLKLLFTYCSYQDRIIDEQHSLQDCFLTAYFENAYLKWLMLYGKQAINRYIKSIEKSLLYTQKENNQAEDFLYTFDTYLEKEQPIIEHLNLIFESFGTAYVKEYALVKAFYLAVLLIDDVEDIREDIVAGRTTLISNYFKKMGIDLQTICPKSKKYWLDISAFLSPWLLKQLTKFSSFKETKIYRSLQSIYNHIQYKLKIE